jgi:hypothetical protein
MIADMYLVTYPRDYQWLPYLFRSIVKHVRGFRNLHVVVPACESLPESVSIIERSGMKVIGGTIQPWLNTYVGQGAAKLMAWQRCDADEVCYLDSDLLFTREFTPDSMRTNGKLRIEFVPWEEAGGAQCWREATRQLLRAEPPYETMRRHPFQFPTMTIRRAYHHVGGEIGYMGVHMPSEFDLLGNYACLFERDKFELVPATGNPEWEFVRSFWTHGGITPEVEAELKAHGFWE